MWDQLQCCFAIGRQAHNQTDGVINDILVHVGKFDDNVNFIALDYKILFLLWLKNLSRANH